MVKLILRVCALGAIMLNVGPAHASDGRKEFEKASRYFQAEEYEAALPFFQKAYRLSKQRPAAVFALAQCERALKMYAPAIEHFQEYLQSNPANAADVQQTIGLLTDLLEQQRQTARAEAEARARTSAEEKAEKDRLKAEAQKRERAEEQAQKARLKAETPRRIETQIRSQQETKASPASEQERRQPTAMSPRPQVQLPKLSLDAQAKTPRPALTASTPSLDDDDAVWQSPWFWVITGAVVVGSAVTAGVLLSRSPDADPYGGTTGVVLRP